MNKYQVITLFPDLIEEWKKVGIINQALKNNLIEISTVNLRNFGIGEYKQVDDSPYGGGPGMVLMPEPLDNAILQNEAKKNVFLTPSGQQLNEDLIQELLKYDSLNLICGRYEGFDQRVIDMHSDYEISIGHSVVSGGEIPALYLLEAILRRIPNVLGNPESLTNETFLELHGDRNVMDDKAMVGGLGKIDQQSFMFIGTQKGYNTKTRQYRNFGMAKPEGYRKALRLMKTAEKFGIPIISFIDTPGAYPGLGAEERGQGQAIANNIFQMLSIKTPIIVTIIGEGASGGALGIGVGDLIYMLENTWYSVISPESCSSILWRSWEHKETAAEALKLTADDMLNSKLIDKIIKEPLGGAHYDREKVFQTVKKQMIDAFRTLDKMDSDQLIESRRAKFSNMGTFQG